MSLTETSGSSFLTFVVQVRHWRPAEVKKQPKISATQPRSDSKVPAFNSTAHFPEVKPLGFQETRGHPSNTVEPPAAS